MAEGDGPVGTGGDSFAKEAVRTMLTEFENNRESLMVVMAGYKEKIDDMMRLDQGLDRRFPHRLHLEDYTAEQIALIAKFMAQQKGYEFSAGLEHKLAKHIAHYHRRNMANQNAGLAKNLVEVALNKRAARLSQAWQKIDVIIKQAEIDKKEQAKKQQANSTSFKTISTFARDRHPEYDDIHPERNVELQNLIDEDFGISSTPTMGDKKLQEEVERDVANLVGCTNMKEYFAQIKEQAKYVEQGGNIKILHTSLHMRITGNPGTGKTTWYVFFLFDV